MRILLVGDSQMEGLEAPLRALLPHQGHTVVGAVALRGQSTASVLGSSDVAEALRQRPEGILLVLGGNDRDVLRRSGTYREVVRDFVAAAQAAGARAIWWFGPAHSADADVDARHAETTAVQRMILPSYGIRFFDSRAFTQGGHTADGVHFTRVGYQAWASAIAARIDWPSLVSAWGGLLDLLPFGRDVWQRL